MKRWGAEAELMNTGLYCGAETHSKENVEMTMNDPRCEVSPGWGNQLS
jgi:hypothetical protein